MKLDIRKSLLAGTALIAVGALSVSTAHAADQTLAGNVTWAVDADQNGAPADGTGAATGDAVDVVTHTLTILNTTADDGGGVGTYSLGAVTGTTGNVVITSDAGTVDMTATVASMVTTSTGDLTVQTLDADDSTVAATITGAATIGGALSVVSTEADAADTLTLTLTGDATVTGTTTLTAGGNFAGANATLNVDGATNVFTGAVTVDGGANAAADAYITLSGASTTFTGGLALDDNTGQSILTVDGAAAQTVAGAITGVTDGDGAVLVTNTVGGVTFTGTVGTAANSLASVTVAAADTNDTSATFQAGVDVTAIVLGNGTGTDTNTVTFDGTTAGYTVAGTLDGTAGDTDNVVVSGGNTITTSGIWGANSPVDALTISGTSSKLTAGADVTATAVTIGAGATLDANDKIIATTITNAGTLDVGADLVSGAVANTGTIQFTGTGGLTGAVTGAGALDVDAATTMTGAITQGTADIAAVTLTQVGGTDAYAVDTTTFSAAGTLALPDGVKAVTGNFTNTTDGEGTITIDDGAGTTTIVGNLGASTSHSLAALTIAGGTTQTVTTTGDLYVDAITFDDADVLQFLGTSAQTVSGTINAVGAGDGVITVGDGTIASDVTFSGLIGGGTNVGAMNVSAAAKARFEANVVSDGAFTNAGDTYVGDGVILEADTITNTGTINLEVKDGTTLGTLEAGDIGTIADTSGTLTAGDLNFNVTGNVTTGVIQIGNGNGVGVATVGTVTDNSYRYTFAVAGSTVTATDDLDVTITALAAADIGTTTTNDNVATALDTLADSTNTQISAIVDNFAAASTQDAANEVLEAAANTVDGAHVAAGLAVSNQTMGMTRQRLSALRAGQSGMSTGDQSTGLKAWGQAFGQTATQDTRGGIDGYDSDTYGLAVGVDSENIIENGVVGIAFSYGDTDVKSKNANTTDTDVDSYQLTLYGGRDLGNDTYVNGMVGYALNNIDTTRHNVGGVAGLTAKGDFDASQFSAQAEVGRAYAYDGDMTLTPNVLVNYAHYSTDSYTETGAGGANLAVNNDNLNILEVGLGVDAGWLFENGDGSMVEPEIRMGARYDLIGDQVASTANFTGAAGTSFQTKGFDPARTTFDIGAGVKYYNTDNWEFTADYDYEMKSDYDSHSGLVRAAYKF
ncbi:MAG: autotransporter domain-containing protein [Alphaproteobacteria bacterium]|nr:autotransporter domain-containing protein [Alphaproteobacteria bacterium]